MNFNNFLKSFSLTLLLFSFGYSSSLNMKELHSNHMELFIHQDIINNFLYSIGDIRGEGQISIINYDWIVSNPRIVINEEKSVFYANVKLKYGDLSRTDTLIGKVDVNYLSDKNMIYIQINDANIDIDISDIFTIVPEDIMNINIDVSDYFSEPFEIDAPQPKTTFYDIPFYDDSTKTKRITLNNIESKIYLVKDGIKIISMYECATDE